MRKITDISYQIELHKNSQIASKNQQFTSFYGEELELILNFSEAIY